MSAADDAVIDRVAALIDEALTTGRTAVDRQLGAMVLPDLVLLELMANATSLADDGIALRRVADGRTVLLVSIPTEVPK